MIHYGHVIILTILILLMLSKESFPDLSFVILIRSSKTLPLLDKFCLFFYNNIYLDINNEIWKPRCERMMVDEFHANIDRKKKHKKCDSQFIRSSSNSSRNTFSYSGLGMVNHIELGGEWLQYYGSYFRFVINCVINFLFETRGVLRLKTFSCHW